VGAQIVGLLAGLVVTPFTIRLLGPARYGLWGLMSSALSYLGLADFGMGSASMRFAGEAYGRGDADGESAAVWTTTVFTATATTIVAVLAGVFAQPLLHSLLHLRGSLLSTGAVALRLIAAACVLGAVAGTIKTPLLVRRRWAAYTVIASGTSIAQVLLVPVALEFVGDSVATAALVAAACALVQLGGMAWFAFKYQPALWRVRVTMPVTRMVVTFGGVLTIGLAANLVLITAERFVLGHYRSITVVAYYAVAARLAALLTLIPTAVVQPIFPVLATLHGEGDFDAERRLYRQALQGMYLVLTPSLVLLAFLAHPFLTVWAGRIYGEHSLVPFYILLGGVWFNSIEWLPITYLAAVDSPRKIAWVLSLEVVPYLAAAALLTTRYGATGAAIVWTARAVIDALIFVVVANRATGVPLSPLSTRAVRALLGPAVLAAGLLVLAHYTDGLGWRTGCSLVITPLYFALTWRLVLTETERSGLRAMAEAATLLGRIRKFRPS
jgi:O-antigen/teichoic acid export membrane protein